MNKENMRYKYIYELRIIDFNLPYNASVKMVGEMMGERMGEPFDGLAYQKGTLEFSFTLDSILTKQHRDRIAEKLLEGHFENIKILSSSFLRLELIDKEETEE